MPGSGDDELGPRAFGGGLAALSAALAAFLLARLHVWPTHEDEVLALFVARDSLSDVLEVVLGERGEAPLHFVFAWAVVELGGGVGALRLVSAAFAVASVPLLGVVCARLAGRTAALAATALACGSWMLLFHGVYGRMYSLFLFTSLLSVLTLLAALERGGGVRWAAWVLAMLATIATHPYGALVLASHAVFVALLRVRTKAALAAFAAAALLGVPFWYADFVLAERFDVAIEGDAALGSAASDLGYLLRVAADFSAGYPLALGVALSLAALGLWRLSRTRPRSALLAAALLVAPALALALTRAGSSASPESRHLIFALPIFSLLVAAGLLAIAAKLGRFARAFATVAVVGLVATQIVSAWDKTPALFTGEPTGRAAAREAGASWLARSARLDDVLFGYEPLFLEAWERSRDFPTTVVPRADPGLALDALKAAPQPLGRGVWVLDAGDTTSVAPRRTVPLRLPRPHSRFEARVFGPFLVVRTRSATQTPGRYLALSAAVMRVGRTLEIGDADVNLGAVETALRKLARR